MTPRGVYWILYFVESTVASSWPERKISSFPGTVSSLRLRGNTRPCYNVVEVSGSHVAVWRKHPFHGQERIIQFSLETFEYEKYTGRIEDEVTTRS